MYFVVFLVLFLVNTAPAILIGENDVTCSSDGSVSIKKTALGSLTSRVNAFGGTGGYGFYGPCHRVVREDVVQFRRTESEQEGSPMRMIIDADDNFHILDIQCVTVSPDISARDQPRSRKRREGLYKNDKVPERDEHGNLITGPEVNNTGLDAEGNLVKSKNFDVNVGMTVNVPLADNAGIDIRCQSGTQISVSNPDPDLFQYFLAYDDRGTLCHLTVRPDKTWLIVRNCDTNKNIKVAFNDRKFKDGVIGGSSILKVFKINCLEILGRKQPVLNLNRDRTNLDYQDYMYYDYEYPNSGPGLTETMKQVCLLVLTLAAALFMERLAYVS